MAAVGKVLVVGGGPAGLCAATVLSKRGIEAEIVELNEDLRPLGSGLTMTGRDAARTQDGRRGRTRALHRGRRRPPRAQLRRRRWEHRRRVEMPPVAGPDYPGGFGIMRPAFWGLLAEMAERAGTTIRLSTTVTAIEQQDGRVEVELQRRHARDVRPRRRRRRAPLEGARARLPRRAGALLTRDRPSGAPSCPARPSVSDDMGMYYGPRLKAGCNPVSDDGDVRLRRREHAGSDAAAARAVAGDDPVAADRVRGRDRLGARADDRSREDRPPRAAGDPGSAAVVPRSACS